MLPTKIFVPFIAAAAAQSTSPTNSSMTPPSLTYLFTLSINTGPSINPGVGMEGNSVIYPLTGGTFSGPRMSGTVATVGGDFSLTSTGNQTFFFKRDARYVLQTSDGLANIAVTDGGYLPYAHISMATGSSAYSWVNSLVAVAHVQPMMGAGSLTIVSDVFQVSGY